MFLFVSLGLVVAVWIFFYYLFVCLFTHFV